MSKYPTTAESIAWAHNAMKPPAMARPTVAELEAFLSEKKPPPIYIKPDGSIEATFTPELFHLANMLAEIERLRSLLDGAYETLGAAWARIHCLPRTSDTELAQRIGEMRAAIETIAKVQP